MRPFTDLHGKAAPLDIANLDTDQIIPKQFLKTVEREGLGKGLFYDLRFDDDGRPRGRTSCSTSRATPAPGVLIAGDNFGCGSSREHAPWALLDFGIRCVIAPIASPTSSTTTASRTACCRSPCREDAVQRADGRGQGRQPRLLGRPGGPDRHRAVRRRRSASRSIRAARRSC